MRRIKALNEAKHAGEAAAKVDAVGGAGKHERGGLMGSNTGHDTTEAACVQERGGIADEEGHASDDEEQRMDEAQDALKADCGEVLVYM